MSTNDVQAGLQCVTGEVIIQSKTANDVIVLDEKNDQEIQAREKTWNFGSHKIKSVDDHLLGLLDNVRAVLIDPQTNDSDYLVFSCHVTGVGWKCWSFPAYVTLYDSNKSPIWQVNSNIKIDCKSDYPFVFEEKVDAKIFDLATYAGFGWHGATFYQC